jgi:hypothetical protein
LNTAGFIDGMMRTVIPKMTSNTAPSGVASASSTRSNYQPYYAFDRSTGMVGSYGSQWNTNYPYGWLAYQFTTKKCIKSYYIVGETTVTGQNPKSWTFEGSNDGSTWDVLDTVSGKSKWYNGEVFIRFIQNINQYYNYRINISANCGSSNTIIFDCGMSPMPLIRSLSGGCAYLGSDDKYSLTDRSLGFFPANNEYDKYIINSTLGGKITAGDDNIWHHNNYQSFCMDTIVTGTVLPVNGTTPSGIWRMQRGISGNAAVTTNTWTNIGFRPVLEYTEYNSRATNIFY